MRAIKDQNYSIRMVDNIKVNTQFDYGPTTSKLTNCFCLTVQFIAFLLFFRTLSSICEDKCVLGALFSSNVDIVSSFIV